MKNTYHGLPKRKDLRLAKEKALALNSDSLSKKEINSLEENVSADAIKDTENASEVKDEAKKKSLASRMISAFLTVIIVVLAVIAGSTVLVPRLLGATPLAVLSGSMQPAISVGDMVFVRPTPAEELQVGDVITFQPYSDNPTLITHRLIEITEYGFLTQGDANNAIDDEIVFGQIKGRVDFTLPLLGYVTNAIPTVRGLPIFAIAGGIALLLLAVYFTRKPD